MAGIQCTVGKSQAKKESDPSSGLDCCRFPDLKQKAKFVEVLNFN